MIEEEMNLEKCITTRRTIHDFIPDRSVDKDVVKAAIAAACWAPNHHLTEPWRFLLLGRETISDICELNKEMLTETKGIEKAEHKYKRWMEIPGWLIVTCQKSDDDVRYQEDYASCCCAIQNLMLILWQQGIGTKWSTGPVTFDERFYDLAWINKDMENVVGLIWYGYPADTPQTVRKPLQQVLTELP
ncbi:MAG TPA: nitroreductase [Thiotrichaceae bacterium]|jgi:nitroreductase|nr:nitroreductase [Thiotrichaceae bacterium]HIM07071.1 nitroreductase [Gammaproteobacteria bacterium]